MYMQITEICIALCAVLAALNNRVINFKYLIRDVRAGRHRLTHIRTLLHTGSKAEQ